MRFAGKRVNLAGVGPLYRMSVSRRLTHSIGAKLVGYVVRRMPRDLFILTPVNLSIKITIYSY